MRITDESSDHIDKLKRQIEEKVAWGSSAQWTHQDFDQLSERIWEKTQTKLSATTLKRLWGKVNYQSQPATNTLNALARFVGYEHWRDFVGRQEAPPCTVSETSPQPVASFSWWTGRLQTGRLQTGRLQTRRLHAGRRLALAVSIPLLIIAVFAFNHWVNRTDTIDPSLVRFTSDPVTQGLPNTVVFRYDVSSVPSDAIAIQQSWDERLRASVARNQDTYTTTYYYPGYFRAKLLADDRVIKEHDLYLKSNGWMTLTEPDQARSEQTESVPHYLPSDPTANELQVSTELLRQRELLTPTQVPWVNYYYVEDFGELDANDFTLETRIKNDFAQGEAVCQTSQVNIICSKGHFALPLSISGCVGQLTMALGKERISGDTYDLSPLGTDLSRWQTLRLTVHKQQATVYLNDQIVYQGSFRDNVGKVVGLRYRFHGPGAVDYVRLEDEHANVVFAEDFGKEDG